MLLSTLTLWDAVIVDILDMFLFLRTAFVMPVLSISFCCQDCSLSKKYNVLELNACDRWLVDVTD